jgi:SAM-dependent methyltransferase
MYNKLTSEQVKSYLLRALIGTFSHLEKNDNKGHGTHDKTKEYVFIPADIDHLIPIIQKAIEVFYFYNPLKNKISWAETGKPKFLDVGCGMGWVVRLASILGCTGYGLEKFAYHAKYCKALIFDHTSLIRYIKADMLKYKNYGDFNIIYFYVPIADTVLMDKFLDHMFKQLKPNTIIIPMGHWNDIGKKDCVNIAPNNIWVYKPTKEYTPVKK